VIDVRGLGGPFSFDPRIGASCDKPNPALCPGRASASISSSGRVPSLRPLRHRSSRLCSRVSPVLWTRPTPRLFPDSFASSASCRGPGSLMRLRARRDLPGSGTILSNVMWPSTPAGRQHLAFAVPHILPSAEVNASAPAVSVFRGSIPHPIRLLCTLRRGRHLPRRNTRYQADATPYLGRTCTGWIAPASPGAPPPTPCRSPGAPTVVLGCRGSAPMFSARRHYRSGQNGDNQRRTLHVIILSSSGKLERS